MTDIRTLADQAVVEALADDRARTKAARDLAAVEDQRGALAAELDRLRAEVDDELHDVHRLEDGWAGWWARLRGTREDRLATEREEHARAALRLDRAAARADELAARADALRRRLDELGDTTARLAEAREVKAGVLADLDDPAATELAAIDEDLGVVTADVREADEAMVAAVAARDWLRAADAMLAKAADWGTWDMVGGGMLSSMAKRGRMDDARARLHHAAQALEVLDAELADLATDLRDAPALDTGGLTATFDVFFDNVVTDWMVQGRLRDARGRVAEVEAEVAEIVRQLDHLTERLEHRRGDLHARRRALLDPA